MKISKWKFQNEILNLFEKESDEHIEGDIRTACRSGIRQKIFCGISE